MQNDNVNEPFVRKSYQKTYQCVRARVLDVTYAKWRRESDN